MVDETLYRAEIATYEKLPLEELRTELANLSRDIGERPLTPFDTLARRVYEDRFTLAKEIYRNRTLLGKD